MFKDYWSLYYDIILIHLVIAYAHGLHCKHHIRMTIDKFHFDEYKWDIWKGYWLIGHVISIKGHTHKVYEHW